MSKESVHTSIMLRKLSKTSDLHSFMQEYEDVMSEIPFCEYLCGLCEKYGAVPERIIKFAQIDRTYGHQLFNGTRKPSRDKVIQLAFGFGMTVEQTQELLRIAGKSALYPRIKRDAAILFCLTKGRNVLETQELLASLELTLLGGNCRHEE